MIYIVIEQDGFGTAESIRYVIDVKRPAVEVARSLRRQSFDRDGTGFPVRVELWAFGERGSPSIVWQFNPHDFTDYLWERRNREHPSM